MSAITDAVASGAQQLLSEIVKVINSSTQVPLLDPTYQHIYLGFFGLAAVIAAAILCAALITAALRRDAGTLTRALSGLVVAGLGGGLYIVLAQFLVGMDNWLSGGVVRVTGHTMTGALTNMAHGFGHLGGQTGQASANMLLILLMVLMLVAGLILWFVLVLRQIAILVVVAFAPLLVAGYLWAPTRGWVRRATEVLVALVFTKTAIFAIFGIGLALVARGRDQSIGGFVGSLVLVVGAGFAPLMMLKLVHFAADTHLAGDALGTLKGGMAPVMAFLPTPSLGSGTGRHEMARHATPSSSGSDQSARTTADAPRVTPWEGTTGPSSPAGGVADVADGGAPPEAATPVLLAMRKTRDFVDRAGTNLAESTSAPTTSMPSRYDPTQRRADLDDFPTAPGPRPPHSDLQLGTQPGAQPGPQSDPPVDPPTLPGPDGGGR
ncbi:MAG: hypothetical protein J2P57_03285 [Acidimicrobiaceae bacterium]|nr:hypothetical protein [Acidimicrobiaceae bacterium]